MFYKRKNLKAVLETFKNLYKQNHINDYVLLRKNHRKKLSIENFKNKKSETIIIDTHEYFDNKVQNMLSIKHINVKKIKTDKYSLIAKHKLKILLIVLC